MARKVFAMMEVELAQPDALTPRRGQVFALAANGHTSQEIADRLGISLDTVNCHMDALKDQFCAINRTHLISQGWIHGILQARQAVRALAFVLAVIACMPTARIRTSRSFGPRPVASAARVGRKEISGLYPA